MSTFRDHHEEIEALLATRNLPDVRLMDDSENCGDEAGPVALYDAEARAVDETLAVEPEPTHAELHARLKFSIALTKMSRRVVELETQAERFRHAINRLQTIVIVAGLMPKDTVDLYRDPLSPI